jgi:hypothetical protein
MASSTTKPKSAMSRDERRELRNIIKTRIELTEAQLKQRELEVRNALAEELERQTKQATTLVRGKVGKLAEKCQNLDDEAKALWEDYTDEADKLRKQLEALEVGYQKKLKKVKDKATKLEREAQSIHIEAENLDLEPTNQNPRRDPHGRSTGQGHQLLVIHVADQPQIEKVWDDQKEKYVEVTKEQVTFGVYDSYRPKKQAEIVRNAERQLREKAGLAGLNLAEKRLELLTELSMDALESEDAKKFLDSIPTAENLLPMPNGNAAGYIEAAADEVGTELNG